jgi:hypothetical protein
LVLKFGKGSIAGYVTDDKFQKRQKDRTEEKLLTPQNWSSYFFTITNTPYGMCKGGVSALLLILQVTQQVLKF